MKKRWFFLPVFILMIGLSACKSDKDNIELSTNAALFESAGGSIQIATGFSSWWFDRIDVDGRFYFPDYHTSQKGQEMIYMEAAWVAVERTSERGSWVDVQENRTNYPRYATITVTSGTYVDFISVIQYAR